MRIVAVLVALAFAVTLAIVVANRLSNDAMAVIVGAVCGISATIPISLGFAIAAGRNWGQRDAPTRNERYAPYGGYEPPRPPQPPVIVIAPPQQPPSPYQYPSMPYYMSPPPDEANPGGREFKIIGDE